MGFTPHPHPSVGWGCSWLQRWRCWPHCLGSSLVPSSHDSRSPGPGSTAGVGAMLHVVRGDAGPLDSSFLPFLEISRKQQLLDSLETFHPLIPSGSPLRVPRVNPKITSLETLALGGSPGGSKISRKRFANKRFIAGAPETNPILFQLFYQESLSSRDQLDETQSLHSNFSLSFCVSLFPSVCVGSVHKTAWEEMLDMFKLSRKKNTISERNSAEGERELILKIMLKTPWE